jgi:hypothetical protein
MMMTLTIVPAVMMMTLTIVPAVMMTMMIAMMIAMMTEMEVAAHFPEEEERLHLPVSRIVAGKVSIQMHAISHFFCSR